MYISVSIGSFFLLDFFLLGKFRLLPPVHPPAFLNQLTGSMGGIAEACLLQPIDVVKTRLQLDQAGKYKGIVHCGQTIIKARPHVPANLPPVATLLPPPPPKKFATHEWIRRVANPSQEEGARSLWKGLTPFATHLTLKYFLRMGVNTVYQNALRDKEGKLTGACPPLLSSPLPCCQLGVW